MLAYRRAGNQIPREGDFFCPAFLSRLETELLMRSRRPTGDRCLQPRPERAFNEAPLSLHLYGCGWTPVRANHFFRNAADPFAELLYHDAFQP